MCLYLYGKSENGSRDYFVLLDFNVTKAGRGMELHFLNHSTTCRVFQDSFSFSSVSYNIIYFVCIGYIFGLLVWFLSLTKLSKFCALSLNYEHCFEKKKTKTKQNTNVAS